jgi:hypothetical protein
VSQGIILLVIIAVIITYAVTRTRRRLGLAVTGTTWFVVMLVIVLSLLALWAGQAHSGS